MSETLPDELLYLVIRFSASIPDLPLSISSPLTSTTLSLKRLIREHLPDDLASNRLRLIHAGKALQDATPLSKSLKWLPPPPRDVDLKSKDTKGKGKAPATSDAWMQRMYIHCSIGDALTEKELQSEATLAANLETSLVTENANKIVASASGDAAVRRKSSAEVAIPSTSNVPSGFDRLLTAGFTTSEVAELRSQFMENLAFTHTPDTMPQGQALRLLEDQWFDQSAQGEPSAIATGDEGGAGWGFTFRTEDGALDDIVWGNLIGFFWPIGALVWGLREEGVWTARRKMVILSGIVVNLIFGLVKWSS
ncbi:hypothetical protein EJ05DRAFT_473089 [Pseudovirgaria hyperparasitica]|uniref:Ubiquitin-like domain-containing protein n=1 Tax=Pseudovirgaria hyperparasitica TaxID=470096 RepID=A0A6A6WJ53_9PEZI|nr:uncharacterized protein EJ05DRAFT_473089 [Pseudovirgaria hyperparasitica]KAF2762160.1 hypothetical protein EJ05DRAFT_473089 [Pseudovirgaria hyperparasitica]